MNLFEYNAKFCEEMMAFWFQWNSYWNNLGKFYDENELEEWK